MQHQNRIKDLMGQRTFSSIVRAFSIKQKKTTTYYCKMDQTTTTSTTRKGRRCNFPVFSPQIALPTLKTYSKTPRTMPMHHYIPDARKIFCEKKIAFKLISWKGGCWVGHHILTGKSLIWFTKKYMLIVRKIEWLCGIFILFSLLFDEFARRWEYKK